MSGQSIEELVLSTLQLTDLSLQLAMMASHRLCVLLGLPVDLVGARRLGDEGTKTGVVGLFDKVQELLVSHREISP